jgi:hypothetical protein
LATKPIPQPNARTFSIVDVVEQLRRGRMRIPEFQRPLRWQWDDVRRLFDSIVKGYPIGNLLLWQKSAPAAQIHLGDISMNAPEFADAWWVVDGQQRLISLVNALDERTPSSEKFALAYDLNKADFVKPPRIEESSVIPLPELFDLQQLFQWFVRHPESHEMLNDATRITKAIREFAIPAYIVEQQDEAVLRDIFDRVNNSGRRLSRAEVFSALHSVQKETGAGRWTLEEIIALVDRECLFGELDADAVLSAILVRRGPDFARDIHDEFSETRDDRARDFGNESRESAYREGGEAILRTVRFLQQDAGVPHITFLPYRYLFVVLSRFFAHFPEPEARNRRLLRRWFWRAAMLGITVFRGGTVGATREMAGRIRANEETESLQRLLASPMDKPLAKPDLGRFNWKAAESRVILCALWGLQPRSFATGEVHSQQQLGTAINTGGALSALLERFLRREPKEHKGWAANRFFLLDEATDGVAGLLSQTTESLDPSMLGKVLDSHALTSDLVSAFLRDESVAFLEGRQEKLELVVDDFVARMAEASFEDTPPLDELNLDDMPSDEHAQA